MWLGAPEERFPVLGVDRGRTGISDYRYDTEYGSSGVTGFAVRVHPDGRATVYLADDLKHGRKIALKVLKPHPCRMESSP